jgi:hypothetical protein
MTYTIRWYPVADPVMHLKSITSNGTPIWGTFDEALRFDEDQPNAARNALLSCRAFHGREEDIVLVRMRRVRVKR